MTPTGVEDEGPPSEALESDRPMNGALRRFPGYRIREELHRSPRTLILRARREVDDIPVILKTTEPAHPTLKEQSRILHEGRVLSRLQGEGIPELLEQTDARSVLVLADLGGRCLAGPLSPERFLELAVALTKILGRIHVQGFLHGQIEPSHLVVSPGGRMELIDFSAASDLVQEVEGPEPGETLQYLSPEQTGRTGRAVDYRTDFYSLGATFYELLAGSAPFQFDDPLELVHAHLARPPLPLDHLPNGLWAVIEKLMAKSPDDRYQSAEGLRCDLEVLMKGGSLDHLGLHDQPQSLVFPEQLFGRENEHQALERALSRSRSEPVICLIHGEAGVGKSSLVGQLRRRSGCFLKGHGDLAARATPYHVFGQACSTGLRRLLGLPTEQYQATKQRLREAIGELAGVVAGALPQASEFLGHAAAGAPASPVDPVSIVEPLEAANQLEQGLSRLLRSLPWTDPPTVVCLDDLQWADLGSLRLLEQFAVDPPEIPILLVAMWRSDEVPAALAATLATLRSSPALLIELPLRNLTQESVCAFASRTLRRSLEEDGTLVQALMTKTGGNPLYLRQFLMALHQQGDLSWSPDDSWTWSPQALEQAKPSDPMSRVISGRLERLPPDTLAALQVAACDGEYFSLPLTSAALGMTVKEVTAVLRPALDQGLILAQRGPGVSLQLRFCHHRIYQAVLATNSPESNRSVHLAMGWQLYRWSKPSDAAVHFNRVLTDLTSPEDRLTVARLNLQVGARALRGGSFDAALVNLERGRELLAQDEGWERHYDLMLELHLLEAAAAALLGRSSRLDKLLDAGRSQSRRPLDTARLLEVRLRHLMRTARYDEALEIALEALQCLGQRLPRRSNRATTGLHLTRVMGSLLSLGLEKVRELPRSQDLEHRFCLRLLHQGVVCASFCRQELVPRLALRNVQLSLRFGLAPDSAAGLAQLALLHAGMLGNIKLGHRLGELALEVSEAGPAGVRAAFLVHQLVGHWTEPLRSLNENSLILHRASLDHGDYAFAQILAWVWCRSSFVAGFDLERVGQRLSEMEATVRSLSRNRPPPQWDVQRGVLKALTEGQAPGRHHEDDGNNFIARWTRLSGELLLGVLWGEPARALAAADLLEGMIQGQPGTPEVSYYHFLSSLARLAAMPSVPARRLRVLRKKVSQSLKLLTRWASFCPQTQSHRLKIVEGELARWEGRPLAALESYQSAAREAEREGFALEEALALERAASVCLERENERLGIVLSDEAVAAWRRWGAENMAQRLEERHQTYLRRPARVQPRMSLDTMSVFKAAQAISREIVWERLLGAILLIAVENAGAERGLLLLFRDQEQLWIEGEALANGEVSLEAEPLAQSRRLAASVARYALRTTETTVVDLAATDDSFCDDPYVQEVRPQSVMAVPIQARGRCEGLLYLENNLVPEAFSPERAGVLGILSAQMAISLENARQVLELRAKHEQVLAEREKRHAEEVRSAALETRKNALITFLGIASHDLKTPIGSILMLARQLGSGQLDPARAQLQIESACRRATGLVRTYLDTAATETGVQLTLSLRSVELDRLVEDEIDFLLSHLPAEDRSEVALQWDLESVVAEVDPERLQQVVVNLVGNALQHCRPGTRIAVTLNRVGDQARLVVEDEGPGIAPALRENLFRPFEPVRDDRPSTGLGLWISRTIVEAHGGTLSLDSPSTGSRFCVELPLNRG